MKRLLRVITLTVILTLGFLTSALGYAEDDVICSVDSLIRGNASQGATLGETALGDITADALLAAGCADVAIVNGGELKSNIVAGACKWSDVLSVFRENKSIAVAEITSAQLWDMLEYGVGFTTLGADEKIDTEVSAFEGFPQVAGITFEYDSSAPVGERIRYILVGDTEAVKGDSQTTFTLCATEFMLSGGYGYDAHEYVSLNMGLANALAEYLKLGEYTATITEADRIITIGNKDEPLIPRGVVLIIGLIGCIFCVLFGRAKKRVAPDRTFYSHIPER